LGIGKIIGVVLYPIVLIITTITSAVGLPAALLGCFLAALTMILVLAAAKTVTRGKISLWFDMFSFGSDTPPPDHMSHVTIEDVNKIVQANLATVAADNNVLPVATVLEDVPEQRTQMEDDLVKISQKKVVEASTGRWNVQKRKHGILKGTDPRVLTIGTNRIAYWDGPIEKGSWSIQGAYLNIKGRIVYFSGMDTRGRARSTETFIFESEQTRNQFRDTLEAAKTLLRRS